MDIQIMSFRHLHHRIHYCTCLSPFGSITEQLVLSPQSKRTDHILAQIIGKTASTIFQIGHEQFFVILGIVHRLLKRVPFLGVCCEIYVQKASSTDVSFWIRYSFRCWNVCPFTLDCRSYSNRRLQYWTACAAGLL